MIINPKNVLDRGIITWVLNPDLQVQQNWIDITVKKVFKLDSPDDHWYCEISEEERILPKRIEIKPVDSCFFLEADHTYDIEFNEEVNIPINLSGSLKQRSSLNRMWTFLTTWVYDSWYVWKIWAILRPSLNLKIKKNTRLAQFVFTFADGNSMYDWGYKKWNSHQDK